MQPLSVLRAYLIGTIVILAYVCAYSAQPVAAELPANQNLNITILADGTLDIKQNLQITNNNANLITKLQLTLLASNPHSLVVKVNGRPVSAQVSNLDLNLDLQANPILSGADASVNIEYSLPKHTYIAGNSYMLFIPAQASQQIKQTIRINYPPDWPLHWNSAQLQPNERGTYNYTGTSALLLIWGNRTELKLAENININTNNQNNFYSVVNLPAEYSNQNVAFEQITAAGIVAYQRQTNNLWWLTTQTAQLSYTANIEISDQLNSKSFLAEKYPARELPAGTNLGDGLLNQVQILKKLVRQVYEPKLDSTTFDVNNFATPTDLTKATAQPSLAYSYLLCGYLTQINIPCNVSYGYLVSSNKLPQVRSNAPHTWVEAVIEDKVYVFDVYLEDLLNLDTSSWATLDRLRIGVWAPQFEADKVLGILNNNPRFLSKLEQGTAIDETNNNVVLAVERAPINIATFTAYGVGLRITNNTPHILGIQHLWWDNLDLAGSTLKINDDLTRAIKPYARELVEVNNLILPSLLREGRVEHVWRLQTNSNLIAELTAVQVTNYQFNTGMLIIFLVITLAILGLIIATYWRKLFLNHYAKSRRLNPRLK
jgi:hypothetical protein